MSSVTEDAFSDIMALEETLLLGVFDMSISNAIEKELKLKKMREFETFK